MCLYITVFIIYGVGQASKLIDNENDMSLSEPRLKVGDRVRLQDSANDRYINIPRKLRITQVVNEFTVEVCQANAYGTAFLKTYKLPICDIIKADTNVGNTPSTGKSVGLQQMSTSLYEPSG